MRLVILAAFVPSLLVAQRAPSPPDARPLAIVGVTIVDVAHGTLLPGRTVVVQGRRIEAVGSGATTRVPAVARLVDGSGHYLIPGLWDLHVHALRNGRAEWMFPLFVASGVLGIRDTGSPLDSLLYYRTAGAGRRRRYGRRRATAAVTPVRVGAVAERCGAGHEYRRARDTS